MSSVLSDLIWEVGELGLSNARVDQDLIRFINRAQRRICERRDWTFTHQLLTVTILANTQTANMPSNFKKLAPEFSPVAYLGPIGGQPYTPVPVQVKTRAEIQRQGPWPGNYWQQSNPEWNASSYTLPMYTIFMEQNAGGLWTINLPPQMQNNQDLPFQIEAYSYLADLALGTDTNALLNLGEGFDMLVNLTKALCYFAEDPTDPRGLAARALYQDSYKEASYKDANQKLGGQSFRW